ncbi:Spo0E like sporulation regulatory protein [Peptoclostridium litorale DSM 5388]|uniref:MEDS domain-containing protein n=1 Tax=Peptoclostridium litorale DSM 5388 TaxID=1121324 RepID=A0A069RI34_PEPLI|nr:MEDS domain-containing protein [Peptoclostridium litorale]KDR96641.1 hypothetical protein CLIT_2c02470 [Peptoclostridium litorale DSM 5388]SIN68167.1 Spo0E like sporulation regulatory protein [Peptoclostridium litorale DSM 5388]
MKYMCTKCSLKDKIEKMKLNLDHLIYEKKADFSNSQIMKLSREIDKYVNECIHCKSRISKLNDAITDVKGCHLSFYYYGEVHLTMNMCSYIIKGIQQGEIVYVSMDEKVFKNLKGMLNRSGIDDERVQFYPVEKLIMLNSKEGRDVLREQVSKFGINAVQKGYTGIRWIGQPSYAIKKTSKNDFLKFESSLSHAVGGSNVSILCIYDLYDYINDGLIIDNDIIEDSFSTHTHLLSEYEIRKII